MVRLLGRRVAERVGAAPWSVSIAVLCVVITAMTMAAAKWFISGSDGVLLFLLLMLVIGPPVLLAASALLTAVYVLPAVILGHWLGRLAGDGRKWWWVAASTALGLLPAVGLPTGAWMLRGGAHDWRQVAIDGLLFAGALWTASLPASLAVHMTMSREDAGRPVRPTGDILIWGTLLLAIEVTLLLALSTP
ncbi:hypothetical protein ABZ745_31665 [Streptomyces sp. NPDC013082]|uniref:hypothetical protein n=1 Tax=Streptomyces TaxID=1883 RepID=UPI003405FC04